MLWQLLNKQKNLQLIGLEISLDVIKLVQINNQSSPKEVQQIATWPLPKNVILKGEVKDVNVLANNLKKMFQNFDITCKNIAMAIPKSSVIIKNTTVDKRLTTQEIESRAWIESNKSFPDLIGDIYLDYQVQGISPKNENLLDIMMVACKKDLVNPYIKAFQEAGLTEKIVDVNCYVLERMINLTQKDSENASPTTALLNLNNENSTLIVIHDDEMVYAHDQTFAGNKLKERVEKFLQEKIKSQPDVPESQDNPNVMASMNDPAYLSILQETLVTHLRSTMHFFFSSRSNINIGKILVSGDCATLPDIAPFIQAEVGTATEVANPFANLTISSNINADELKQKAPSLMLCTGLALSDIEQGVSA